MELGELMCQDALHRNESCGGHFREEYQETEGEGKGEAKRDDANFMYVAAWEWQGEGQAQKLNKEPLVYEEVKVSQRSYK
jgi:succinate dehydrogenase / fumarate reductase, flavoprotein subunit